MSARKAALPSWVWFRPSFDRLRMSGREFAGGHEERAQLALQAASLVVGVIMGMAGYAASLDSLPASSNLRCRPGAESSRPLGQHRAPASMKARRK